ncbi:GNAT family N-acetyltransferase [Bacillus sp. AFS031507]|uniref:GNAT family N-acetyltransferase n=1 Tax=Bacillus sp. AFS031507 TaxID=2033496 RepID=UPI000BFBBDBC|nr:GNAT family N-acetyltransferase [Bacillus sp. AFS031507]PGY10361.1 GNAT family N-acetyltransferase [Bacillus sp. AFS031507]
MDLQKLITIRMLHTAEELTAVRDLESLIWADEDPVPVNHSIAVVKNGGMVIGAFSGTRLIGFQYSFPGFDGTKVYLCSHSMGIHPDFRKMGIGEKLKLKQREEARKMGYQLITWTYDPLETVNGYLNLSKLGGACTQYIENCYGEMPDILNAGLPSDRFLVEWNIAEETSKRMEDFVDNHEVPLLIQVEEAAEGLPVPKDIFLDSEGDVWANLLYVPVPNQFQTIKANNLKAALEWRMKTRKVFTHYLSKGWTVTALRKSDQPYLHHYVLTKKYT